MDHNLVAAILICTFYGDAFAGFKVSTLWALFHIHNSESQFSHFMAQNSYWDEFVHW